MPTLNECDRPRNGTAAGADCQTCADLGWGVEGVDPAKPGDTVCAESDFGFECINELRYDEAETACFALGARLCTAEEIVNQETAGTGCGHDARMIWSSSTYEASTGTTCNDAQRIVVKGQFDHLPSSIVCRGIGETSSLPALRCCADVACAQPCSSGQEETTESWRVLFRQTAGNYRSPTDWIRYNSDDTTSDFSVLNELEGCRQADGKLHLKLVWPGWATGDPHHSRIFLGYFNRLLVLSARQTPRKSGSSGRTL